MRSKIDTYVAKKYNNWLSLCKAYSLKLGYFDPRELLNEVLLQMYQCGLEKAIDIFSDKPYKLDLYIKSSIRINAYSENSIFNRKLKSHKTFYIEEMELDRWENRVSVFDKRTMLTIINEAKYLLHKDDLQLINKRFNNTGEAISQQEYARIRDIILNMKRVIFNKQNHVRYERPT